MDEMENQELPLEPEHKEEPIAEEPAGGESPVVTEEAPSGEECPVLPEEAPAEEESPLAAETAAEDTPAEAPAAEEAPAPAPVIPPVSRPRRRPPYENSPYMMSHQPPRQAPPVQTPPEAEAPVRPEAPEKPRKERRSRPVLSVILVLLAIAVTIFASVRMTLTYCENYDNAHISLLQEQIADLQEQLNEQQNTGNSVSGTPNVSADGLTPGQVYARNEKSVVLIETENATGSGFILTEDGYVVTNYHVVEDGMEIYVVLHDRSYHEAELVGYEAGNEVALLKMEGEGYQAVTLGSSDALVVGDQVAAIGNPLGELTSTLTVGFVSATGRNVSTDSSVINMIQTDCAINSGNSGGPLFNMKGEVVGITSAKYSGMSASGASIEGIGFAIPIDDVLGILEDLMEFGYVKSAYLGVSVYTLEPSPAYPLGCLVDSVVSGGCADKAGVLPGDIIIELAGFDIDGYTDLGRALREFEGGETVTIVVWREGVGNVPMEITLDAKPREDAPQTEEKPMPENGSYEEWYEYFFGE